MKLQSNKYILLTMSALSAYGMSFAAQAASKTTTDAAMDVCIEAFVSEQIPQNHPLKIVKRDNRGNDTLSRWNFPQRSTIEVSAKGRYTGADYGSAMCVVDRKGELVAMEINNDRVRVARSDAPMREPQG
jgi:hypothetical protein